MTSTARSLRKVLHRIFDRFAPEHASLAAHGFTYNFHSHTLTGDHVTRWNLQHIFVIGFGMCLCTAVRARESAPSMQNAEPAARSDDTNATAHSASLSNSARYEDATLADLSSDHTYTLPGFIDGEITFANLRLRFGTANVREMKIDGAEGEQVSGIVLFANDPLRRADMFIRDDARHRGIATVRVSGRHSRWHFDNGVQLGMTLDALVIANGKPIVFSGLDWDYGGNVTDWNGGRLAPTKTDKIFRGVQLAHAETATESFPLGEGSFRSDDKKYPKQGGALYVGALLLSFADPDRP